MARFLFARQELVKNVFKSAYDELIQAIYAKTPENLYLLAARSLRSGGWLHEARQAISKAHEISPENKLVLQEIQLIDSSLKI